MHGINKTLEVMSLSPLFDEQWYVENYRDVPLVGVTPLEHFKRIGVVLGRNPGPDFNLRWYLERHSDVRNSKRNPVVPCLLVLFKYVSLRLRTC